MRADLRRPWPFALFVLLAHTLSRFLAVSAHEFLGHGTAALLLGGSPYGAYVSPGSGITYVYLPPTLPAAGTVAMLGAGIGVEVVIGVALWWYTRRSAAFAIRAFGLVAATVFVVYAFVYMAAGAFDFFPGDTGAIVSVLQDPPLAYGFAAVGTLWTFLVSVLLSFDVVRLFGGPSRDLKRELMMLILFWLVPAPLAFLPGFSAYNTLGPSPIVYVGTFALVLTAVAALLVYTDLLPSARVPVTAPGVSWRSIAAAAIPLLIIVPVWAVGFGVTQDTATGVLLETPPVQAEQAWVGELAVNLEVVVHPDLNVSLYWRYHGTFTPTSPLEARITASYRDRMDRDFYNLLALTTVGNAMNESNWRVVESDIHPNETVWARGASYPDARVVRLGPSAFNRFGFLVRTGNNATLTVHDPFKFQPVGPPGGWLDALKISWEPPLVATRFADGGGTTIPVVSANYVLWQNFNGPNAHTTYAVTLLAT